MPVISTTTNASLKDGVRRFSETYTILQPVETLDMPLCMVAPFDFTIDEIHYRTQDGSCDIYVYIDDVLIELDDAQTGGEIQADSGAVRSTTPDSTDPENYLVPEGSRLSIVIDNITTHTPVVELQFDCTKVQANNEG